MPKKSLDLAGYLQKYEAGYPRFKQLAHKIQDFVEAVLESNHLTVHLVAARAKTAESVREKIQRKAYKRPSRQLTDKIGIRVITYYRDDVDKAVEVIQNHFDVHRKKSVDKRTALGLSKFGYRSVHLFACPKRRKLPLEYLEIGDVWCEIQVRSLLEHAWAEIEHEVVYKSGTTYPKHFSRQFAALAGALEILDSEFLSLRGQRNNLIDRHRIAYSGRNEGTKRLDSARLVALLECDHPDGMGWRRAAELNEPFRTHSDAMCVVALRAAGVLTANSLRKILREKLCRRLTRVFADHSQLMPNKVSHFAAVLIALASRRPRLVEYYFPDVALDPGMAAVLALARKRKAAPNS